jgi:hypothetical protein
VLTHSVPHSEVSIMLGRRDRLRVVVCCAALPVAAALVGLGAMLAAVNSGLSTRSETIRKSHRLPVVLSPHNSNVVNKLNDQHQLLDGCEPLASRLVQTPASRIPGRCLS